MKGWTNLFNNKKQTISQPKYNNYNKRSKNYNKWYLWL